MSKLAQAQRVSQAEVTALSPASITPRGHDGLAGLLSPTMVLIAIFLVGLGLRAYCLDCRGLWYDEIASVNTAQRGLDFMLHGRFGWMSNQTLVHYLLVWVTLQFADPATTTIALRLPSLLAGGLTPLVVYGLGSRTFGKRQGLLAAFMAACATVLLGFSQDLRPYAMITFLTALSVYCLLRADQGGQGKWWFAFATVTIANLLTSYFVLTLVLPALVPYLFLVLRKLWLQRNKRLRLLMQALGALGGVGLVATAMLLDLRQLHQTLPDLAQFSPVRVAAMMVSISNWLPLYGGDRSIEYGIQMSLYIVSMLGFYAAIRAGGHFRRAAVLFGLLLLIPCTLLALISTTTFVLHRYLLFQAPFYFLLVSNGLVLLLDRVSEINIQPFAQRLIRTVVALLVTALISTILLGAFNHIAFNSYSAVTDRPDYRSIAIYLSGTVDSEDTVVVVDDPAHGITVLNFYWQGDAPAAVYDARDPRLFQRQLQGDIYWVVGLMPTVNEGIVKNSAWVEVKKVPGAVVLKENPNNKTILDRMNNMVSQLEAMRPGYLTVLSLRGSVYQAQGNIQEAVRAYRRVGTAIPLGAEHLLTAEGFAALGETDRAWQEAVLSKFDQPARPEIHQWMAEVLSQMGMEAVSISETEIANALQVEGALRTVPLRDQR